MRAILSGHMAGGGIQVEWAEADQGFLFIWMRERKPSTIAARQGAQRLFRFLTDLFGEAPEAWLDFGTGVMRIQA